MDDHHRELRAAFNQILDATKGKALDEHTLALRREVQNMRKQMETGTINALVALSEALGGEGNEHVPAMFVATAILAGGIVETTADATKLTRGEAYAVFVRILLDDTKAEFES